MDLEFELTNCPLRLGCSLKVPATAWRAWGIDWKNKDEFQHLVNLSERSYAAEWRLTDDRGLKDIADASRKAGLSDCNTMQIV